ncbi:MAG: type II toxin-antitoxin system RelE/ParE family toxin [Dehalococcoidia bacterium]
MAFDIRFASEAETDLENIIDFFGPGTPGALRFAERFDRGISQLLQFPESAPANEAGARLLYLAGTSFFISYEYNDDILTVLAVPHSSSDELVR